MSAREGLGGEPTTGKGRRLVGGSGGGAPPQDELSGPRPVSPRTVRILQWAMVAAAVGFIGGIVVWITHLIRTAWRLQDVPSASIGISLVAIPVFLTLLGVVVYVFWGLLGDRSEA